MVYYHLQHFFSLDNEWHDIPHVNCGCSINKSEVYDAFDELINLGFTKVTEYRIILSGSSDFLPRPKKVIPLYTQLTLF